MTRGRILLFVALFVVGLIMLMPLSVALPLFGLTQQGFSARAANGTIWSGTLADARIGRLALGDMAVGLRPVSLLIGRVRIDMQSVLGRASMTSASTGFALDDATVQLDTARLFAPLPVTQVDLTDVSVTFASGACRKAEGRARAVFTGDVGGLTLTQGLSGGVRCDGGALLLPLVSQSAMERLTLRISGGGGYRADFIVKSTDPVLATRLASAGFAPVPGGFVRRLAGKF